MSTHKIVTTRQQLNTEMYEVAITPRGQYYVVARLVDTTHQRQWNLGTYHWRSDAEEAAMQHDKRVKALANEIIQKVIGGHND